MIQVIEPNHKITIEIQYYQSKDSTGENYIAWIKEPEYKGIIIESSSISGCLKELFISLESLEKYRKNIK